MSAFTRALAQHDFNAGVGINENPFTPDTVSYATWKKEYELMARREERTDVIKNKNLCESQC